ncbi:lipase lipV [Mycolicibacterium canariasense]|uniref:Lipase lipV n=1 Tax=Mycolicibacterium canariasense TaxID=228230 RepID=A0A100W7M1_MYCCR|nr:alpha/beta hydrolase [Mycolicibacterium canariasense]MCV7211003.1 alpha/beta hydrolase [Mycolicibacterium canariasense]ORV01417.1 alpha/beta hydrolase [Mycolicibacterium canariasense]GAS93117.1 lipase lipV [Mycolicibacterium canariasense]
MLHTYRYGPASPVQVLAIHGLTGHGKRWETLASGHLPDVSVLAPDLIGHGRSTWAAPWTIEANVAALADLLDSEATGPVLVAGHSFGGAVALTLAASRPDLVSGLVLLDPAVALDGDWMREIADAMLSSPDYPDRDEARADKLSGSWGEVPPDELERELDEHLVALPDGRVGWRISIPAAMSYWSELTRPIAVPANRIPVTLIRATRTTPPYVSDALIDALRAALGDRFALVDLDCDHMVGQARPAETAAVIRDQLG